LSKEPASGERTSNRPENLSGESRWIPAAVSGLILVLVLFGIYSLSRSAEQRKSLDQHYVRWLSRLGEHLVDTVGVRDNALRKAWPNGSGSTERLNLISGVTIHASTNDESTGKQAANVNDASKKRGWRRLGAGAQLGSLVYSDDETECRITFGRLIEPLIPDGVFRNLALANGEGLVVWQLGENDFNLVQLPTPPANDGESDPGSFTHIREVEIARTPFTLFVHPVHLPSPDAPRKPGGSEAEDSTSQGNDTTGSRTLAGGDTIKLRLVGLVPTGELESTARRISPTIILFVGAILLLGLLTLPLIKLRFPGARTGLRLFDVRMTVLALVLLSAATGLTVSILNAHLVVDAEVKAEIKCVADQIEAKVAQELTAASAQLAALTRAAVEQAATPEEATDQNEGFTRILERDSLSEALQAFPFLEMVWWIDETGMQLRKWTVRDTITSLGCYPERAYFREPLRGNLIGEQFDAAEDDYLEAGFYVQSIVSKTQAKEYAVLARRLKQSVDIGVRERSSRSPSCTPANPSAQPIPSVAAIEWTPLSLVKPVLPRGTSFALVDRGGNVQFHSDPRRNLRENVLNEVESAELAALLHNESSATLDTRYVTRPVKAHIRPLEHLPWTVIVFREVAPVRTRLMEAALFSAFALVCYIAMLLVLSFFLATFGRGPRDPQRLWFWPDPDRIYDYFYACLALLLLLGLWFMSVVVLHGPLELWMSACCAFLSLAIVSARLRRHDPRESTDFGDTPLAIAAFILPFVIRPSGWNLTQSPPGNLELTMLAMSCAILAWRRLKPIFGLLLGATLVVPWYAEPAILSRWLLVPWAAGLTFLVWNGSTHDRDEELNPQTTARFDRLGVTERRWTHACLRHAYASTCTLLLLSLGVAPSLSYYSTLFGESQLLKRKADQLELVLDLEERAQRLEEAQLDGDALLHEKNQARPAFARHLHPSREGEYELDVYSKQIQRSLSKEFPKDHHGEPVYQVLAKILPTYDRHSQVLRVLAAQDSRPPRREHSQEDSGEGARSNFEATPKCSCACACDCKRLEHCECSLEGGQAEGPTRMYLCECDTTWSWRDDRDRALYFAAPSKPSRTGGPLYQKLRPKMLLLRDESRESLFPRLGRPVMVALLLSALLYLLVLTVMRRIFFVGAEVNALNAHGVDEETDQPGHYLVLRGSPEVAHAHVFSPNVDRTEVDRAVEQLPPEQALILPQFHHRLNDPEVAQRKLAVLERLVEVRGRKIFLVSSIDPLYYFEARAKQQGATHEAEALGRWARALSRFDKIRRDRTGRGTRARFLSYQRELRGEAIAQRSAPLTRSEGRRVRMIARECFVNDHLQKVGRWVLRRPDWPQLEGPQISERVHDLASAHYRRLWLLCSKDEKVLLHRLAQEGFVNWRLQDTVLRLLRRRLIVDDPHFEVMNESFRRFVISAEPEGVFRKWERQADLGLWHQLRIPILLGAATVLAFYFATQKEALDQTLLMLATLTGSAPLLISVLGLLLKSRK